MSKQVAVNSFNDGLTTDFNALAMPKTTMTDCLNGTIITYNGNEFILQNDMGNARVDGASSLLDGYIPIGMKEYGGIIYIASLNPLTNDCQIGSIPSPNFDTTPINQTRSGVTISYSGATSAGTDFNTMFIKLFEPEQLLLHPGDKYKLVYTYTGSDETTFKNKYKLNYFIVDENGKRYTLDNPNIVSTIGDAYAAFKSTIAAVIAVEISINSLSYFDVVIRETSNPTNTSKVVSIKVVGTDNTNNTTTSPPTPPTADDLFCAGAKIDYKIDGSIQTPLYITRDDYGISKLDKTGTITGFINDNVVEFEVTPYNQYNYDNSLKRKVILKMGETITSTGMNKYFQYNLTDNILRLDFDMNVMNFAIPNVYVEFYDLWSDYSVIIPIEDINTVGKNSIFVDVVDEPGTAIYDTVTRGGTSYDYLQPAITSTVYKSLMNGTNNSGVAINLQRGLVRKTQVLRSNHLYAVRLCAVETSIDIPVYYNIYKLFFNNTNFNTIYSAIRLNPSDIRYDFTQIAQPITDLTVVNTVTNGTPTKVTILDDTSNIANVNITTNDSYYTLDTNINSFNGSVVNTTQFYSLTQPINIVTTITKPINLFGSLVTTGANITTAISGTIVDDDKNLLNKSYTNYSVNGTINNYNINLNFYSKRSVQGTMTTETRNIRRVINTISIWSTLYTDPRPDGHSNYYYQFFASPPATDTHWRDADLYSLEKPDESVGIFRHFWNGNGIRRTTRLMGYVPIYDYINNLSYTLKEYNCPQQAFDKDSMLHWMTSPDFGNIASNHSGVIVSFKNRPFAAAGSDYTSDPIYGIGWNVELGERPVTDNAMIFMKGNVGPYYNNIPYSDWEQAKQILKDLSVYEFAEDLTYLTYLINIEEDLLSTSTYTPNVIPTVSATTKLQHIIKSISTNYVDLTSTNLNISLANFIVPATSTNINVNSTFGFTADYSKLIMPSFSRVMPALTLNDLVISESCNEVELAKFRNSKLDLNTFEQTTLESSNKTTGTIYSTSGNYSNKTNEFIYQPIDGINKFIYNSSGINDGYWMTANEEHDHNGKWAGYGVNSFTRYIE